MDYLAEDYGYNDIEPGFQLIFKSASKFVPRHLCEICQMLHWLLRFWL